MAAQGKQQEIPVRFYRTAAGTEPVLEWLRSRPPRDWSGLDAYAIRLARRDAFGAKPEGWPVGSSINATERAYCAADFMLLPRYSGCTSWLY